MNVLAIGSVAAELLEEPRPAVVQGLTRLGAYLRLDPGWVVFLSRETWHGPLTLNIEDEPGFLDNLSVGDHLPVRPAERSETSRAILLITPQVWSAPPPHPDNVLPAEERVYTVTATVREAQRIRHTASLSALQAVLDGDSHPPEGEAGHFFSHLVRIKDLLVSCQRSAVKSIASPLRQFDPHAFSVLLGLGRGLTPTGDDILLGLLLALSRWRPVLATRVDVGSLDRDILVQAYQRTTTLSANLVECAARGQADERLVTALDGLMTGARTPTETAALLASWGSSSGFDALCGMALAIAPRRLR